jgi:chemotaxis protein histidine kinase CheA
VRGPSIILITSLVAGSAVADPAAEAIRGMDQCFALARSADAICGHSSNPASTRLDCLRRARDAEEQCLEQVRSSMEQRFQGPAADALTTRRPTAEPQLQSGNASADGRPEKTPEAEHPGATLQADSPAPSPSRQVDAQPNNAGPQSQTNQAAAEQRSEKTPEAERPAAKLQVDSPVPSPSKQADAQPNNATPPTQANQAAAAGRPEQVPDAERPLAKLQVDGAAEPSVPGQGDAQAKPAAGLVARMPKRELPDRVSSGWIVGETVSPVDFSPLLVAQINSVASNKPDAPSALVLRCRAGRTEMSLRTQGSWHAGRAGVVEVVFTDDRRPAQRSRWSVASDGKSASLTEDAISAVQGLLGTTISISVSDGGQDVGTATFELAGIDAVREKLAKKCRWPAVAAQSRVR